MVITPVDYMLIGVAGLQTLSAAVSAMPKPKSEGFYSFLYSFLHILTVNLDSWFEKKTGITVPGPTSTPALPPAQEQH